MFSIFAFPGVGIVFLRRGLPGGPPKEIEICRVEGALKRQRDVAAMASSVVFGSASGIVLDEAAAHVVKTLRHWFQQAQIELPAELGAPSHPVSRTLNWDALSGSLAGLRIDLVEAPQDRCSISQLAYSISSPDAHPLTHEFIHRLTTSAHLLVAMDQQQHTLAEGKGYTAEQARRSATGEVIERLVAQRKPPADKVVSASQAKLRANGIATFVPELGDRDLFSEELVIDWVAGNRWAGQGVLIPAEKAYFEYKPRYFFHGFEMLDTVGLSAGRTHADAVANGLLECLERDAYAVTMRCRLSGPAIDLRIDGAVGKLLEDLGRQGIEVHARAVTGDWPVPIIHVLLLDREDRLPKHSHGCSAALSAEHAFGRALLEAVQIHDGLCRFADEAWIEICERINQGHSTAWHAWVDPTYTSALQHLLVDPGEPRVSLRALDAKRECRSIDEVARHVIGMGHDIVWTELGSEQEHTVVRVLVRGTVRTDARHDHYDQRLRGWVRKCGLPGPYYDAILS